MWPLGLGAQPGLPALLAPGNGGRREPGLLPQDEAQRLLASGQPSREPRRPARLEGLRPGAQLRSLLPAPPTSPPLPVAALPPVGPPQRVPLPDPQWGL